MKTRTSHIGNRCGISKIITIILGIVVVGMTAYAYNRVWKEELFLGICIGCLIFSIIYLSLYIFIKDLELKTTNVAVDSGLHFLAALLLLASSSLMLYSAVDLRRDIEYLCSGGFDRGFPCFYDKHYYGQNYPVINGAVPQGIPLGPYDIQGPSGYGRLNNGFLEPELGTGRSFLGGDWLTWLKSSKAHLFEKCYDIFPRIFNCNRYYELKITAGIIGLLNGLVYGITGIMVITSN